jgi:hypothetical protein
MPFLFLDVACLVSAHQSFFEKRFLSAAFLL